MINHDATPVLEMIKVGKVFAQGEDEITALQSTTFSIKAGELVAILGPSGSGKSTFLTIAGALQAPTSGQVLIDGQNIGDLKPTELAHLRLRKIGFILQASNLVPYLTINQQLTLIDIVTKNRQAESSKQQLFEHLGIDKLQHKYPADLSGGERQRAAIAKALYGDSRLILADEPTASLDTKKAYEVAELLKQETVERKKATIMVTHDERLIKYCTTVYRMEDGVLRRDETRK